MWRVTHCKFLSNSIFNNICLFAKNHLQCMLTKVEVIEGVVRQVSGVFGQNQQPSR